MNSPKERPILFNGPMVRAILEGRKTQTRRVVKGRWSPLVEEVMLVNGKWVWETMDYQLTCPYGQPGDRLWVRETWTDNRGNSSPIYRADLPLFIPATETEHGDDVHMNTEDYRWTPSIHMPRWASRITLEIVSVRVERLQDISEADSQAEGCYATDEDIAGIRIFRAGNLETLGASCADAFRYLWGSINGPESWKANPWVWVIEFKRVA